MTAPVCQFCHNPGTLVPPPADLAAEGCPPLHAECLRRVLAMRTRARKGVPAVIPPPPPTRSATLVGEYGDGDDAADLADAIRESGASVADPVETADRLAGWYARHSARGPRSAAARRRGW